MASEAVMVPATVVTVQNVETVPVQAGPVQATVVTPQAVAPPMVVQAKVAPVQATIVSQPRAVQAGLVQPQNGVTNSTPAAGTSTLLPQHPQGKFRFDLCERCCTCQADCWMAWCCGCFPVAQMLEKLVVNGTSTCLNYNSFLFVYFPLLLLEIILYSVMDEDNSLRVYMRFLWILFTVGLTLIRQKVREHYNIQGSFCADCCCSCCCTVCVTTQLVGQMWVLPSRTPGCDMSKSPASMV